MTEQPGRADLLRWRSSKSANYFDAVPFLESNLRLRMGSAYTPELGARLRTFGEVVASEIEPAVTLSERHREFPQLRPYDELGQLVEEIEFHPSHDDAARAAWASGMLATPLDADGDFELAGLFYLLSHVGEGGQACPIVCTLGLRRAIEHRADGSLRERYLGALASRDAATALRGSQFLTEVQGGSDVGANAASARPDHSVEGAWRISGEKWFCSVADADLFALTARPEGAPEGTRGLACFLVPRSLDGVTPNGFRLRRLKDKLGTRALASAEIDFVDALAWPIGGLDEGFNVAVTELLNTSRWLNALGSAGIMSRAYLEASSFARHREAFGQTIDHYETVREQLAIMRVEAAAALASSAALTAMVGALDDGSIDDQRRAVHRVLVNANKYVTSVAATDAVHRAIEVLGGNGTIEDFSPLPRLYRDAIVFESWEGTHNVLCAQVRRDLARLGLLAPLTTWLDEELGLVTPDERADVAIVRASLERLLVPLTKAIENPSYSASEFRRLLTGLTRVVQATCLLRVISASRAPSVDRAVAGAFIQRHLVTLDPEAEAPWLAFTDAVLEEAREPGPDDDAW